MWSIWVNKDWPRVWGPLWISEPKIWDSCHRGSFWCTHQEVWRVKEPVTMNELLWIPIDFVCLSVLMNCMASRFVYVVTSYHHIRILSTHCPFPHITYLEANLLQAILLLFGQYTRAIGPCSSSSPHSPSHHTLRSHVCWGEIYNSYLTVLG